MLECLPCHSSTGSVGQCLVLLAIHVFVVVAAIAESLGTLGTGVDQVLVVPTLVRQKIAVIRKAFVAFILIASVRTIVGIMRAFVSRQVV